MQSSISFLPELRLSIIVPFLIVLAACGDSGNAIAEAGADASSSTDSGVDGTTHAPQNPVGLGPAPIALGAVDDLAAAGSYVLLAKTGVTNVTGSSITGGHIGVSPEVAAAITGFGETLHMSGTYATSAAVVPPSRIYASNFVVPTPSNLTTAVLGMQGAYTDGAARTNPDHTDLSSGNLAGLTLTPGLYRWGSAVTVPDDVTLAGGANDVFIFQIADDLDVSAGKRILLTGGARARNIFFVVAGQVTIHANAHFEGIILSQTGITLQTMASMHGRAFAQSLIAIDDNAITAP